MLMGQAVTPECLWQAVGAHLMMMLYALTALGYFLGVPGGRLPSDCMRTCPGECVSLGVRKMLLVQAATCLAPVQVKAR